MPAADSRTHRFVVIGGTNLARRVCAALEPESNVTHLVAPGDEDLRAAALHQAAGVAVLEPDDVTALRYALAAAHLAPATPLIVTIFDQTVSEQVVRLLPTCHVFSPAAVTAPSLVAACLDDEALAIRRKVRGITGLFDHGGSVREEPWELAHEARSRRLTSWITGQFRPHDAGSWFLVTGLAGLLTVLLGDWAWLMFATGHRPAVALHEAVSVVTAVGPANTGEGGVVYLVLSAVAMLATTVFSAIFTAGVLDRLWGPRLVGLIGTRTVPRSGHVVVVGLGQVGLRLCQELQRIGVAVVGVERDRDAPCLRIARALRIPVLVAHGGDRVVLERLAVHRARALAAVGSNDLDNIAVAVTAHGVAPGTRIVLRAGEHEAIAETRSLLPLGATCDVTELSAAYVASHLVNTTTPAVVGDHRGMYVEMPGSKFVAWHGTQTACSHPPR